MALFPRRDFYDKEADFFVALKKYIDDVGEVNQDYRVIKTAGMVTEVELEENYNWIVVQLAAGQQLGFSPIGTSVSFPNFTIDIKERRLVFSETVEIQQIIGF